MMNYYDSAIKELKKILELAPDNYDVHLELGRLYREKGEYALAEEEIQKALKLNSQRGEPNAELALIYEQKKEYRLAMKQLQSALNKGLNKKLVHNSPSRISHKQQVLEEFEKAIEIEPEKEDSPEGIKGIESIMDYMFDYMFQEGYKLFLKKIEEIAKAKPNNLRAHIELAWIYSWHKQYDLAIEELKRISEIDPHRRIHIELGRIYRNKKEYNLAIKEFKKILKINSNNALAHIELGKVYIEMGNYDFAIKEFEEAIRINPTNRRNLSEVHDFIINFKNCFAYPKKGRYKNKFNDLLNKTDIRQIPNNDFNEEFILTLKNLFPGKEKEIEDLIRNLPIYSLWKWRYPVISYRDGEILYFITRLLKPAVILETGTWMGTSTSYLAKGCYDNKRGKLITVDKEEDVGHAIPDELLPYIEFHKEVDIRDALPIICNKETKIDMFFHDSEHSYQHARWEIEEVLPFISKGGLIVLRDVSNRNLHGMTMTVVDLFNEIKKNVESYFFNTIGGIGVIKDIGKLKIFIKSPKRIHNSIIKTENCEV